MKKEIEIKNGIVYYNGVNLKNLALKYKTPLRVSFLDIIKDRVKELKEAFDKKIKELDYKGKFIYVNANKANYEASEIKEAVINGDGIETSSYHDLKLSLDILKNLKSKKVIISNGYKTNEYKNLIIEANKKGVNIITIIDSLDEYNYYKSNCSEKIVVGLRLHLKSLYQDESDIIENDRFGLNEDEIEYILNDIKNTSMILKVIHFHQRGFEFEEDKFYINIDKALKVYKKASMLYTTVDTLDIGGGTPLPVHHSFDYDKYASSLIKYLKKTCQENEMKEPNIVSENGKYSQKDSTINIYKVVGYKHTDKYEWQLLDGSLLIAMPELFALGEDILVMPINNLTSDKVKGRLSSITCDCDDVYFDDKEKGYMLLPKENKNEPTFVGVFGTGSYQASMNGKGGIHHCLLPEELDLVIYTKNGNLKEKVRKKRQSYSNMKKLTHLKFKK